MGIMEGREQPRNRCVLGSALLSQQLCRLEAWSSYSGVRGDSALPPIVIWRCGCVDAKVVGEKRRRGELQERRMWV